MTHTHTTPPAIQQLADRLRASKAANSASPWRRYDSVEDAEPVPVKRTRQRKPTLVGAAQQAAKAGLTVTSATSAPDGSVTLTFGDGSTMTNPWDEVLTNAAH